jgi:hypothetical protein
VVATARAILDQCNAVVCGCGQSVYQAPSRALAGGTIGKHVRHELDHFRALLDVAHRLTPEPVEYDTRARGVPVETDPAAARAEVARLGMLIGELDERALARPVRVRVMLTGDGVQTELASTVGRELFFAVHHAIHHHAMIKAIAGEHGLSLPNEFGTAPSTISFERSRG